MDWNGWIPCQSDGKNFLDLSKTINQKVCGYTLLVKNIETFIEEGIALSKKITVDLNYLRSEGRVALTLKQNCRKWHKNCAFEVTSCRLKKALSNVI